MKKYIIKSILAISFLVLHGALLAQNITVSGIVRDADNQPLIGVSLIIEGTFTGTSTNQDGEFSMEAPASGVLVASYIGYNDQRVEIGGKTYLDIALLSENTSMEEIVIIGYGQVEKKDLTGSIQSVGSQEITKAMTTNAAEALSGRVSGVSVSKSSNRPGSDISIEIRGTNSINFSNEPLYVIDGVPSYSGLNAINSSDIASIDVLKDASSCAIYGSRGANGVVIVTTKGAHRKEGFTIDYQGVVGVKNATRIPDMIGNMGNGDEYVEYRIAQWDALTAGTYLNRSDFLTDDEKWRVSNGEYYDWLREISSAALTTNHNITGSGATENSSYTIGFGYLKDDGLIGSESFERYSANIGLEHKVSDRLKLGVQSYTSFNVTDLGASEALLNAYLIPPIVSPYDDNGDYLFLCQPNSSKVNPFVQMENNIRINEEMFSNSSLFLEFTPIEALSFKSQFSYQHSSSEYGEWIGTMTQQNSGVNLPSASKSTSRNDNVVWDNTATYKKTFNKKHAVHGIALFGIQKETHTTTALTGNDLPYDSYWHALGTAGDYTGVSSNYWEAMMASAMLRLNYIYDDRYLFTATGRYDGTSRLSKENRWGFMPSVAFGWNIAEEGWMKSQDWLDILKLRVSYGKTGNNNLDHDITLTNLSQASYSYGGSGTYGFGTSSTMGNSDLRWEMTSEVNLGLDIATSNNRLSASVDVYKRTTEDLIMQRSVGGLNGYTSIYENIGTTSNSGVELTLKSVNVASNNFNWSTNFNVSRNVNKIVELYGDSEDDLGNRWFIGESINSVYNYNFLGIWQEEEAELAASYGSAPGHIKIEDRDGNGTFNEDDYMILGTSSPEVSIGMNNTFTYKNFDLSVYVYAEIGGLYNDTFTYMFTGWNNEHWNKLDVNYWTAENRSNEYPAVGVSSYYTQVLAFVDGTFLKIQNITLGYTFEEPFCKRLGMNSARIYANVLNPFTFSNYLGSDPEVVGEDIYTQLSLYPMTFNIGLNLTF